MIVAKPAKAGGAERPSTAPAKAGRDPSPPTRAVQAGSTAPKPVKRPATSSGPVRKPSANAAAASVTSKKIACKFTCSLSLFGEITGFRNPIANFNFPYLTLLAKGTKETKLAQEKDLSQEEIDEKASELFSAEVLNGLADSVWKNRLAAVEDFDRVSYLCRKTYFGNHCLTPSPCDFIGLFQFSGDQSNGKK